MNIEKAMQPRINEVNIVDEKTITPDLSKTNKKETLRMLEESFDSSAHDDPARPALEKVWKGVKQFG